MSHTVRQLPLAPLAQYVPGRVCATCDVCCHFPEADSFLRPYFTAEEIRRAGACGIPASAFPNEHGGQIALVPNPTGEGYICPAYDVASQCCSIYADRPLDCQLYPLALMWNADQSGVVLGWDSKCPFIEPPPSAVSLPIELSSYAREVAATLECEPRIGVIERNPALVTRFQEDVVILQSLPVLTERLRLRVRGGMGSPLTVDDRVRFESAARRTSPPDPACPSAWLFANHALWRDRLRYSWREIRDCLCLFAECADGWFMPVPPRGGNIDAQLLGEVFGLMNNHSRGHGVARIERVPRAWADGWTRDGYLVVPHEPEYVYRADDLVQLKGDRYKSQRAACNKLVREHEVSFQPFDESHREECLALHADWMVQKRQDVATHEDAEWALLLLEDSETFHRRLLDEATILGLTGQVVRVDGRLRAYTFGARIGPSLWCVLAEVADRSIVGLSNWTFREAVRRAAEAGCQWVNSMDASGLSSLARSKQAYHPAQVVELATVYES